MPKPVARLALTLAASAVVALSAGCTLMAESPETTAAVEPSPAASTSASVPSTAPVEDPSTVMPTVAEPSALEPGGEIPPIEEFNEIPLSPDVLPATIEGYTARSLGDFSVYSKELPDGNQYTIYPMAYDSVFAAASQAATFEEITAELVPGTAFCGMRYSLPVCVFDSADHGVVSVSSLDAPLEEIMIVTEGLLDAL